MEEKVWENAQRARAERPRQVWSWDFVVDVSEARRLRALEDKNARLKRITADLSVQNRILKEVNAKNGEPVSKKAGCPT
jgi:hypothetical protein